MAYKRSDRIADLIKEEVASMLIYGGIKDPRIGLVTITGVTLSGDLKHAKVFFSMLGTPDEKENTMEGLRSAVGFVRKEMAKRLNLRYTPTICFEFDSTLEYSSKIEGLIKKIKEEKG